MNNLNRALQDFKFLPCEIFLGGYNPESAYENELGCNSGLLINGDKPKYEYFFDLGFIRGGATPNYESEIQDETDIMQILGIADRSIMNETIKISGNVTSYNQKTLERFAPTAKRLLVSNSDTGISFGNSEIKSLKEDYNLPLIIHPKKYTFDSTRKTYWPNSITGSTAVNNGAGYDVGISTIIVDSLAELALSATIGKTFMFENHSTIYKVVIGSNATSLVFTPALTNPIIDGEAITPLVINNEDAAVNLTSGYNIGATSIAVDVLTKPLLEGTIIKFSSHSTLYVVDAGSNSTLIKLKSPLTDAVINDEVITNQDLCKISFNLTIGSDTLPTLNASGTVITAKNYKVFYKGYKLFYNNLDITKTANYYEYYSTKTSFADKDFTVNHQNGLFEYVTSDISKSIEVAFKYLTNDFDITVYQAVPNHSFEIPHQKNERTQIPFEFEGIKDESREDGDQLFRIGYGVKE